MPRPPDAPHPQPAPTRPAHELARLLSRLDGAGYAGYRQLSGAWEFQPFALRVVRVQPDPFAPPSRLEVVLPAAHAGIPDEARHSEVRRRALADWLARQAAERLGDTRFKVDAGGQEVLARSACAVSREGGVTLRLALDLPGPGRRVDGGVARSLLCDLLPQVVERALRWPGAGSEAAWTHLATVEDACALRDLLAERGLVAFVADGSILPRVTGVDDRPLTQGAIAFASPPELRVGLSLPNRGPVTGMGLREGVTLIVGGGFHGKSTVLRAIERGVYDHVPGDGRELAVARSDAVRIRAEDGRCVSRVDISGFVSGLPLGRDTTDFSTANASGSTSQAANLVEALEVGARVLLIDEDTAATNLMVRDARMRALVPADHEPLTPLVDVVRSLHRDHGVSTVLVMGGCGDYLDVADTVVMMDELRACDVTAEARRIAAASPRSGAEERRFPPVRPRCLDPGSVTGGDARRRIRARGLWALTLGDEAIQLGAVEQLVDPSQVPGAGLAMIRLAEGGHLDGRTLRAGLESLEAELVSGGLEVLAQRYTGDFALPRRFEVAAALNRLPSLRIRGFEDG
jgi:predicted ABC-class ATPase